MQPTIATGLAFTPELRLPRCVHENRAVNDTTNLIHSQQFLNFLTPGYGEDPISLWGIHLDMGEIVGG